MKAIGYIIVSLFFLGFEESKLTKLEGLIIDEYKLVGKINDTLLFIHSETFYFDFFKKMTTPILIDNNRPLLTKQNIFNVDSLYKEIPSSRWQLTYNKFIKKKINPKKELFYSDFIYKKNDNDSLYCIINKIKGTGIYYNKFDLEKKSIYADKELILLINWNMIKQSKIKENEKITNTLKSNYKYFSIQYTD